jgi:hypothetical protein
MVFLSLGEQEIKIAICRVVLFFSFFYLVNLSVCKFGPHPGGGGAGGVRGVNRSKWEVRVASGPS